MTWFHSDLSLTCDNHHAIVQEPGTTAHPGEDDMSNVRGQPWLNSTSSDAYEDESEVVVLDASYSHWQLVEYRPDLTRRALGVDPYNSAEAAKRRQPWLRVERR